MVGGVPIAPTPFSGARDLDHVRGGASALALVRHRPVRLRGSFLRDLLDEREGLRLLRPD